MARPITKLLVANRGEIAIRVFRAATELRIKTVAIYTHEDRFSLHRYKADQAFQIGANDDPLKPYLDIQGIIDIAVKEGVDAIHPGYGFLSENPDFARACEAANIIWIGPSPTAMEQLGDKLKAKKAAIKSNVPIVKASPEPLDTVEQVKKYAAEIGFPIMVKAATGGGGRGMRVVHDEASLATLYTEASREAMTAFGNGSVFVEKYINDPKHIEVQILGDSHGNLVHLFERDCSVQRRFQKVVEVAPAIGLRQETKEALHRHAVAICSSVGYVNAGTVEFLVDKHRDFYFMEMNTRIQVEHTVTEEVIDHDLIKEQIKIAAGEKIGKKNYEPMRHAIECRINAEDIYNNFRPTPGKITSFHSPKGHGVRVDTHVYSGYTVSPYYDSMIAKLITRAQTREECIKKMQRALNEFIIEGLKTTVPIHQKIMSDENFQKGDFNTGFLNDFDFGTEGDTKKK